MLVVSDLERDLEMDEHDPLAIPRTVQMLLAAGLIDRRARVWYAIVLRAEDAEDVILNVLLFVTSPSHYEATFYGTLNFLRSGTTRAFRWRALSFLPPCLPSLWIHSS